LRRLVLSRMVASSALVNNPICPTHRLSRNTLHRRHYSITRISFDPGTKNPDLRSYPRHRRTLGGDSQMIRHIAVPATGPTSDSARVTHRSQARSGAIICRR